MSDGANDLEALRASLTAATKPVGKMSMRALSLKAGLGQDAVRDILNGRNMKPSYDAIRRLYDVILEEGRVPIEKAELLISDQKPEWLPRWMYVAEYGAWRDLDAVEVTTGSDSIVNRADQNHPGLGRYGVKLADESMMPKFMPGDILECWSTMENTAIAQPGHVVVVQRQRAGLIETTIRNLEAGENGNYTLTFSSTERRYAERLPIPRHGWGGQADEQPNILGVVRGMYRPL